MREGFDGSDETLPRRLRRARCLAFQQTLDGELVAVAALKAPDPGYRGELFERARAGLYGPDYDDELGWVYVTEACRDQGLGERLSRSLLERVDGNGVFSTTRPDNAPMIHILGALGFRRAGQPFPHPRRPEEILLFVRPPRASNC